MRSTSAWYGWTLCLCASLAASAQDYPEDDEMIVDLIREDGTAPGTGAEPAAEFLKCNKVLIIIVSGALKRIFYILHTACYHTWSCVPDKLQVFIVSLLCRDDFYIIYMYHILFFISGSNNHETIFAAAKTMLTDEQDECD